MATDGLPHPSPEGFQSLFERLDQQLGTRDGWAQVGEESETLPFLALVDLWPDSADAVPLKAELLGRVNNRSINAVLLRLLDGPRPQTPQPCRLLVHWADGATQAGHGEIYLVANYRDHLILTVYLREN